MAGPARAGKTTILKYLTHKEVLSTRPTLGYDIEHATYQGLRFTAFDLGGQDVFVHSLWKKAMIGSDAIVFVVDAASEKSIKKSQFLLDLIANWIPKVPFMLLANKQDLPNARSPEDLLLQLNLGEIFFERGIPHFRIFATSAITGKGIHEAFSWLFDQLGGIMTFNLEDIHLIIIYDNESGLPITTIEKISKNEQPADDSTFSNQKTVHGDMEKIFIYQDKKQGMVGIWLSDFNQATKISGLYAAIDSFARHLGTSGLDTMVLKAREGIDSSLRLVSVRKEKLSCFILCREHLDPHAVKQLGGYLLDILLKEHDTNKSKKLTSGIQHVDENKLAKLMKNALLKFFHFSPIE